jgi:hypothetical protein
MVTKEEKQELLKHIRRNTVLAYADHKRASYNTTRELKMEKQRKAGAPIEVLSSIEIIVTNDLFLDDLEVIRTPLDVMEAQIEMALDIPTIRLSISLDGLINTMAWPVQSGMVSDIKDTYENVDELPEWIQLKLATLMLLDADEPNKKEVVGVGRRISESIFWVYPDGSNTGKEDKEQGT